MKNNNKFRLDVWGAITLVTIALYALFLLYPMAYLIRQSVLDPDTGSFTLAYFTKFFSKSYYTGTIVNSVVLVLPSMIYSETNLSYLGIVNLEAGNTTSVGTLISAGQKSIMAGAGYVALFPCAFLVLLMLSFNLFGNGLRDALNPSLRGSEG